ncbi:GntR family transcriptional regulator [Clostridium sp. Marseille-P2415]|uniref:GntR family transcriptional regulator n=1 Tax=Clostridium sp. Marseille-P2415 TaxID=1805471 RepID=UPI001F21335F|nr:GntR family transcriptional regulator [Clostridium sp. Marseille-P2415]
MMHDFHNHFKMRKIPAYMVIHDLIKKKIQDGTYPVSELLPTEPELEKIYNVSRTTIRSAMEMLKEEGLVEIKQGRGTMVLDQRTIQDLNKVTSVTESLKRRGFDVRTKSMYIDIIHAGEQLLNELDLKSGDLIARIQRIQLINEKPIAIMKNYIPHQLVPDLEQFTNKFSGLYEFLEEHYHLEIDSANDKIFAKSADFAESEMLGVKPGTALLCIRRICYKEKEAICVDDVRILGDQYELMISMNGRYK